MFLQVYRFLKLPTQQPSLSYNFLASLNHYFNKNNGEIRRSPSFCALCGAFYKGMVNELQINIRIHTYGAVWWFHFCETLNNGILLCLCVNDLIVSPFIMNSESKISLTTRYWFYFFYPITLHFVSTLIILYSTPRSHDIPGYCLSTLDELGFDVHMPHVTIALRTAAVLAIPVPLHLLLVPGIFSNCIDQTSHVPSAFDKTISLICINAKKS